MLRRLRRAPLLRIAPLRQRQREEARLLKLLALLVVITVGCGVATGVTVYLAPAYADEGGGY
jgi:hypothetical protein